MRLARVLVHRLRSIFRRSRADADLEREIALHFEQLVRELVASGLSESEARIQARREFGSLETTKESCRDQRRVNTVENLLRDLRYALRALRTKPGFSLPALLSLALGIGANVAIFSVVNAVLIRPLPYASPERLAGISNSAVFAGQVFPDWALSLDMYAAYRDNARSFEEFGVWTPGSAAVTGTGAPQQVTTVSMTSGVLRALAAKPVLGRWFSSADERPGAPRAVILSYHYWQQHFAADPRVLGRLLVVDFVPYQVVGIMPRNFEFLNVAPDLFLAQTVAPGTPGSSDADYFGVARLKPGITLAQARQDIARVLNAWAAADPSWRQALAELHVKPNIHPLKQDVIGDVGAVLEVLMGALAVVLLLVCANVANLVQVRAQSRRDEFAIRAALGAGWSQIARQLIVEGIALAVLGGAAGLALAYAAIRLLLLIGPQDLPRLREISIDSASFGFALACSLVAGLAFGLMAALGSALAPKLRNVRTATQTRERLLTQSTLVVAQVALALILLVGAGLLIRSFAALTAVKPGFTHPEQIQTIRLFLPDAEFPDSARVVRTEAQILNNIAAIPGVQHAAFATALPLELEYHNGNPVSVEGKTPPGRIPPNRTLKQISPGLFATLGTRLVAGRDFTWDDLFQQRRVAIISENMAREYWSEPSAALGQRLRINGDGPWSVIVGVAENVYDDGVDQPPPGLVYFPGVRRGFTLAIRTSRAGSESLLRDIGARIHSVDPNLPLAQTRTLRDLYRRSMARRSIALVLLAVAAAIAVLLAFVGVYGVLAYTVAQRRREISIRLAVGAEPATIRALFLRQSLALVSIGAVAGLLAARLLVRYMASLLFGVPALDLPTYAFSALLILLAALAAGYIPARRAALLNPIESLRAD
ncbi:MAG TPA: ABC transporter permease [Bryobacteraceae bacterium]|jgi:predicted permease|nr:ABC transporter permease [Bryobacteraceae bacterium]